MPFFFAGLRPAPRWGLRPQTPELAELAAGEAELGYQQKSPPIV